MGQTDMRRGIDALARQVQHGLGRDPHWGDLYLFRGRQGDLIKVLWADDVGLSLYIKRLERGRFMLKDWAAFTAFLTDGRICLTNNAAERALRGIAMRVSLYTPWLSACKHWKCVGVNDATRATCSGHRRFDRIRREVVGTDLMRCAGDNLHSRKHAGFDKSPYHVVCDA